MTESTPDGVTKTMHTAWVGNIPPKLLYVSVARLSACMHFCEYTLKKKVSKIFDVIYLYGLF